MSIKYLNGDEVTFVSHDDILLDATMTDGTIIKNLQPRLLFPLSNTMEYISFQDEEGEEAFILKSLEGLPEDQLDIVSGCISEYYRIPKITSIIERNDNNSVWVWSVMTDRGPVSIEMAAVLDDLKKVSGERVIMKDNKSNRYEIPDVTKLRKKDYNTLFYET